MESLTCAEIKAQLNEIGVKKEPSGVAENNVTHPSHYTQGDVECIDAIKSCLSPEEFSGYLGGNVMKYLWRYRHKGNARQDLEKAQWYLDRLHATVI